MKFRRKLALDVVLSVMYGCVFALPAMASEITITDSSTSPYVINDFNDNLSVINGTTNDSYLNIFGSNDKTITVNVPSSAWIGYRKVQYTGLGGQLFYNYTNGLTTMNGSGIYVVVDNVSTSLADVVYNQQGKMVFDTNLYVTNSTDSSDVRAVVNVGTLTFNKEVNINSASVSNAGNLEFNGKLEVYGINMPEAIVYNEGVMHINGETHIGSYSSTSMACTAIENSGELTITGDKNISITGDIVHKHAVKTEINLIGHNGGENILDGSTFRGAIKGSDSRFSMIIGNKGLWTVENQSERVEGINLNGGTIDLHLQQSHPELGWKNDYTELVLHNFKSNNTGKFIVGADLANNKSDTVIFTGTLEASEANIQIFNKDNNGGVPIRPIDGHSTTIVRAPQTSNLSINATGAFYSNVAHAQYEKFLPIIVEGTDDGEKLWKFVGWEPDGSKRDFEQEKQVNRNDAYVNVRDVDTTIKRLNDIRTDPAEVGVWIRGEKGKNKIRNYNYEYNLMSGGYDWHNENDARKLFYGLGITYSTNKCDDGLIGDGKSTGFNLYGSWLGKKHNEYIDVVLKYGKLDKEYGGLDKYGVNVSGDYDKDLFIVATKYGRRYYKDNGLYFEPQVGYTYGKVGSANYVDSQNTHIHADATNSHILSFDMQVGKNIKGTELYSKLGYVYDLDGKINVSAPGVQETDDMGGGYVRWTVGASRKVGKNNSFYCDIEKDFGSKVKKPYAVSLGYRHTF